MMLPQVKKVIPHALHPPLRRLKQRTIDVRAWARADFASPAPTGVKWSVLRRYGLPTGIWLETGTNIGNTTAWIAQTFEVKVISLEPQRELFNQATQNLQGLTNVSVRLGTSEDLLENLLTYLEGPVTFWLDGHYSGGNTYLGATETPIRFELETIGHHLSRWPRVAILIDDFRCFPVSPSGTSTDAYPSREYLVSWASSYELDWTVEHDIFVATKSS